MNSFSISDLARYSGIKPHTIRIWEKRYGALSPGRSTGNTRNYDNKQLRRLLNISGLLDSSYKVSELCAMSDRHLMELNGKMLKVETTVSAEFFVSQLIAAALTYDESHFVHVFSHCMLRYGLKATYLEVLHPALVRIGLLWLNDSLPASNEHFISNLIRQKLLTAIDSLTPPKPDSPSWILFLPENEFHETGLLLAYYLIRVSGHKVIYLGGNVPEPSLRDAVHAINADNLLLFLVRRESPKSIQQYLDLLGRDMPVKKIHLAAAPALIEKLKPGKKIVLLNSVAALEKEIGLLSV